MKRTPNENTAERVFPGCEFIRDFPPGQNVPGMEAGAKRCFWAVEPTGRYDEDCRKGEDLGIQALRYLAEECANGPRSLLAFVAKAQALRSAHRARRLLRDDAGLRVGFWWIVAAYAAEGFSAAGGEVSVRAWQETRDRAFAEATLREKAERRENARRAAQARWRRSAENAASAA